MTGAKTCVVCGTDCTGKARVKDPKGRYYCKPCHDRGLREQKAATASAGDEPMDMLGAEADAATEQGGALCPMCISPVPAGAGACPSCGAPQAGAAGAAPPPPPGGGTFGASATDAGRKKSGSGGPVMGLDRSLVLSAGGFGGGLTLLGVLAAAAPSLATVGLAFVTIGIASFGLWITLVVAASREKGCLTAFALLGLIPVAIGVVGNLAGGGATGDASAGSLIGPLLLGVLYVAVAFMAGGPVLRGAAIGIIGGSFLAGVAVGLSPAAFETFEELDGANGRMVDEDDAGRPPRFDTTIPGDERVPADRADDPRGGAGGFGGMTGGGRRPGAGGATEAGTGENLPGSSTFDPVVEGDGESIRAGATTHRFTAPTEWHADSMISELTRAGYVVEKQRVRGSLKWIVSVTATDAAPQYESDAEEARALARTAEDIGAEPAGGAVGPRGG